MSGGGSGSRGARWRAVGASRPSMSENENTLQNNGSVGGETCTKRQGRGGGGGRRWQNQTMADGRHEAGGMGSGVTAVLYHFFGVCWVWAKFSKSGHEAGGRRARRLSKNQGGGGGWRRRNQTSRQSKARISCHRSSPSRKKVACKKNEVGRRSVATRCTPSRLGGGRSRGEKEWMDGWIDGGTKRKKSRVFFFLLEVASLCGKSMAKQESQVKACAGVG